MVADFSTPEAKDRAAQADRRRPECRSQAVAQRRARRAAAASIEANILLGNAGPAILTAKKPFGATIC